MNSQEAKVSLSTLKFIKNDKKSESKFTINKDETLSATFQLKKPPIETIQALAPVMPDIVFRFFPSDSTYSFGHFRIPSEEEKIEVSNDMGFIARSYHLGNAVGHAYNNPHQLEDLNEVKLNILQEICMNEEIKLELQNTAMGDFMTYELDLGDGVIRNNIPEFFAFSEPGQYLVQLKGYINNCESFFYKDTITVFGTATPDFIMEGKEKVSWYDTVIYDVPLIESSSVSWTVEGGEVIENNDNQITVFWNGEAQTGTVTAIETTIEGCIGNVENKTIDIDFFLPEENDCLANFLIFPNPVINTLYVSAFSDKNSEVQANIIGTNGQIVNSYFFTIKKGKNTFEFDVKDLHAATYFLDFQGTNCQDAVKWVKLR